MDYEQACLFLHQTLRFGMKLGLSRMHSLLTHLHRPQEHLRVLHVAGTNGKGSVSVYAANILAAAGHKTGLFTSPYLQRLTERVRILAPSDAGFGDSQEGDDEIGQEDFARIMTEIKAATQKMLAAGDEMPTEFEILTALALCYFREQSCDLVVLEVGLGGRMDSTNVIQKPLAALITAIGYDHMDRLGKHLRQIAHEKGGIIKQDAPTFLIDPRSLPLPKEEATQAHAVIREICREKGSKLNLVSLQDAKLLSYDWQGQTFEDRKSRRVYQTRLLGIYQPLNALLAARVCLQLGLAKTQDVARGLAHARWPARMEVLRQDPPVILDGAHNPQSCQALRQALDRLIQDQGMILITGVLQDKSVAEMMDAVIGNRPKGQPMHVIVTTPDNPRAMPADKLADLILKLHNEPGSGYNVLDIQIAGSPADSVHEAKGLAEKNGMAIVAFGSLYLMGELRTLWQKALRQG